MTGIPHPGGAPAPGSRNPGARDCGSAYGDAPPGAARPGPPPQRVAVTGPRRHRAGGYSVRPGAADLHAQPRLGQIYVRSLVRDQLRLSLGVLAVLAVVIGGLPAAFALVPVLRTAELGGIRLAWLLLGVVAYPVLVGAAWFHVRHAERGERDFAELLSADPLSVYEPPAAEPPADVLDAAAPPAGVPGADGPPTAPGRDTGVAAPGPGAAAHPGADTGPGTPGARNR